MNIIFSSVAQALRPPSKHQVPSYQAPGFSGRKIHQADSYIRTQVPSMPSVLFGNTERVDYVQHAYECRKTQLLRQNNTDALSSELQKQLDTDRRLAQEQYRDPKQAAKAILGWLPLKRD